MAPQVVQYPRATSLTAHSSRTTGVEGARGPGYGARGRWRGLAGLRDGASPPSTAGAAGVEGAGGSGGHGRASRSTTPSEARVWRSRGRPDPTVPGTPAEPQATSLTTHSSHATGVEGAGGSGGRKRAWPRCRWAAAGPGQTTSRRAEPRISDQAPPVWRAPEGPEGTGGLRDRPLRAFRLACGDLAGGRARRRLEHQRSRKQQAQPRIPAAPPVWRPPRGLQGLAGLRDDAPSEARGADGERAGRPRGGR